MEKITEPKPQMPKQTVAPAPKVSEPKQPKAITTPAPAPKAPKAPNVSQVPQPKQPKPTAVQKFNEAKQASKLYKMNLDKPKFDHDFYYNSFKDGYKLNKNKDRAGLGLGRLQYLVDSYGVWNEDQDYSQAYLTHINPNSFISGTLTDDDEHTNNELKNIQDLDLEKINNVNQTPFLYVDFDNNEIVGHEGRHRLASFAKAGINKVPVVVVDKSPSFEKYKAQLKKGGINVRGQEFGDDKRAKDVMFEDDMVPINYKNLKALIEKFGDDFDD